MSAVGCPRRMRRLRVAGLRPGRTRRRLEHAWPKTRRDGCAPHREPTAAGTLTCTGPGGVPNPDHRHPQGPRTLKSSDARAAKVMNRERLSRVSAVVSDCAPVASPTTIPAGRNDPKNSQLPSFQMRRTRPTQPSIPTWRRGITDLPISCAGERIRCKREAIARL